MWNKVCFFFFFSYKKMSENFSKIPSHLFTLLDSISLLEKILLEKLFFFLNLEEAADNYVGYSVNKVNLFDKSKILYFFPPEFFFFHECKLCIVWSGFIAKITSILLKYSLQDIQKMVANQIVLRVWTEVCQ